MEIINSDDKQVKILELNNTKKYAKDDSTVKKSQKNINKTHLLIFDDEDIKDYFHDYL